MITVSKMQRLYWKGKKVIINEKRKEVIEVNWVKENKRVGQEREN